MNITSLVTRALTIAIIIVATTSSALAAFDFQSWPHSRPIDTRGASGMVKVSLPTDIVLEKADFSDVRIIDGQGGEVPYLLTRGITSSAPTTVARVLDVSTQVDGTTRFIADAGRSGVVTSGITIATASSNFRRQVSVYASDSLLPLNDAGWSLVTSTGYIFAFTDPYSGYASGRSSVSFSANTSRYFKVVIGGGPEGSISVNGASLASEVSVQERSYTEERGATIYNDAAKKATEVTVDLGSKSRLSDEVTLRVSGTNYSRRVLIEASDEAAATSSWRYVGQGSISGVSTTVFQGYSGTISYPEQRARYIRVSIVNDDNPPLSVASKVTVGGPILGVIFEAQAGKSYSMYYGNWYATKPNYDLVRISSYIEEQALPAATMGSEITNPEYVAPEGPVVPYTESHKGLLNGALVIVVLIIAALIALYLRMYMKRHAVPANTGNGFMGGANPVVKEDSQQATNEDSNKQV
ncbi:MAG: DUF3999 family protein [Candidatus Pacebacteria bacterium]|nr:DUF3999 family protein [Candidatus Paceibacterota bacterium]